MLGPIAGSVKAVAGSECRVRAASGREMPRGGQTCERVRELFAIERLDQETVHSGFETGIAILHQRVRRERKDRRLAAGLAGLKATDPLGGFDAVAVRA